LETAAGDPAPAAICLAPLLPPRRGGFPPAFRVSGRAPRRPPGAPAAAAFRLRALSRPCHVARDPPGTLTWPRQTPHAAPAQSAGSALAPDTGAGPRPCAAAPRRAQLPGARWPRRCTRQVHARGRRPKRQRKARLLGRNGGAWEVRKANRRGRGLIRGHLEFTILNPGKINLGRV